MSFLPSASPPAVHQLKNSNLPEALVSGLMPSAASAASMSSDEELPPVVAVASVPPEPVVAVGAAAAVVLVGAGAVVGVAVSGPQEERTGRATIIPAASHARRDFAVAIVIPP